MDSWAIFKPKKRLPDPILTFLGHFTTTKSRNFSQNFDQNSDFNFDFLIFDSILAQVPTLGGRKMAQKDAKWDQEDVFPG